MKQFSIFHGFLTFLKIGLFTIGGGYAMIPLIEREVVERHKWMGKEEFIDLMSLSQALPGVFAVNFSIYIGQRLRGLRGSLALAAGVVLPSFIIILLVAMFFMAFADNKVIEAIFKGVRPAVVALIAVPCVKLGKTARILRLMYGSRCWWLRSLPLRESRLYTSSLLSPWVLSSMAAIFRKNKKPEIEKSKLNRCYSWNSSMSSSR